MSYNKEEFLKVPQVSGEADFPVSKQSLEGASGESRRTSSRLRQRAETMPRYPSASSLVSTGGMSIQEGDSDASASSSTNEEGKFWSRKKKRKKTPPTATECVGLAQAKRLQTEAPTSRAVQGETEQEEEEEANLAVPRRKKDTLPSEEELAREVRYKPTADIGGRILESVEVVEKVASVSRNLKGGFIRDLKLAARTTRVAVAEMAKRTTATGDATELEEANLRLRAEVHGLREEVGSLRAEIECLRRRAGQTQQQRACGGFVPPPPPPLTPSSTEEVMPQRNTTPTARLAAAVKSVVERGLENESVGVVEDRSMERGSEGETLMERIGALIERKLGEFREELFPGRAIRPPLGRKVEAPPSVRTGEERERGKEKGKERKERGGEDRNKKGKEMDGMGNGKGTDGEKRKGTPVPSQEKELWSQVVGRKAIAKAKATAKVKGGNKSSATPRATQPSNIGSKAAKKKGAEKKKIVPGRPPKIAAVTLTIEDGSRITYAEAMLRARDRIKISDLGIAEVRPKRAITGAIILEVPGEESTAKADALASKMQEVFAGTEVRVARPMKRTEIRVTGLIDSVTEKEVVAAVAACGGCQEGDIHAGDIRMSPSGLGSLWLRCPTAAARKLVEVGRIMVGWTRVRVEALAARPLQCYRCLEKGHVRQRCTSGVDRSGRCYACGELGHKASACNASAPKCPLCADLGRPANHRLGGPACSPPTRKVRGIRRKEVAGNKEKERSAGTSATSGTATMEVVQDEIVKAGEVGGSKAPSEIARSMEASPRKAGEEQMEVEGEPAHEKRGLEGVLDNRK